MKSIIQEKKECLITGYAGGGLQKHHIFGAANRDNSEKYGLWVWLRYDRHIADSPYATPHNDRSTDLWLKRMGQRAFEQVHGSRDEFIRIFGRNYLGEENED